jgi:hypothetical protein
MGLCYKTGKWLDRLWSEHIATSQPAADLVTAGIGKQGPAFAGFPADLHARLYLQGEPQALDNAPEWATKLHEMAGELAEWGRLRVMCARNGFAAGIATECMLESLLPHVPDAPKDEGQPGQEQQPGGQSGEQPQPGQGGGSGQGQASDADLRATIRKAARQAAAQVQEAEAEMEGVETPLGISSPGTAVAKNTGPANMRAVREAHRCLRDSPRLKRIAELAGRLERVAAAKARSKVKPGVGEVHGVGMGSDLARLLPSELVALRHPRLKLALFAKLMEGRALTYEMSGRETETRGPVVVLLDESSSMREDGKDVWSKAVALALLSTATKQRRSFHLVAFNGDIVREIGIEAGRATPKDLSDALDHRCEGGTDFNAPVLRACELVRTSRAMKKADVVVITDGEDLLNDTAIKAATNLTKTEGVSWFCVGVGRDVGSLASLVPIATSITMVRDVAEGDDPVAPVINLEAASTTAR